MSCVVWPAVERHSSSSIGSLVCRDVSQRRFLVTCYTRSLASQLRLLLSDHDNVEVMHLDGMMSRAITSAGLHDPGFDDGSGEELVAARDQGARARLFAALPSRIRRQRRRTSAPTSWSSPGCSPTSVMRTCSSLQTAAPEHLPAEVQLEARPASTRPGGRRILRVNYRYHTREILELASGFLFAGETYRAGGQSRPRMTRAPSFRLAPRARQGPEPTIAITTNGDLIGAVVSAARAAP